MAKSLVDQTEALLRRLHERVRRAQNGDAPEIDLASQLKLVAASTAFLAAKAKLVPEEEPVSGLAALRDALSEDDKPKTNGAAEPEPPPKPQTFANY